MKVAETVGRQFSEAYLARESLDKQDAGYGDGHEEQDSSEDRIQLADDFVDGQECGHYVISEHYVKPYALVPTGKGVQQVGGPRDK